MRRSPNGPDCFVTFHYRGSGRLTAAQPYSKTSEEGTRNIRIAIRGDVPDDLRALRQDTQYLERGVVKTKSLRVFLCSVLMLASFSALAGQQYGPGVNDTEIRIGQTMAYSGLLSALGSIGKVEAAYFAKVNEEGGLNGRKIRFSLLTMGIARLKRWNTPAG